MPARIFHVSEDSPGTTVAAALAGWLPDESAEAIHKLIRTRRVQFNGNVCVDGSRRLRPGDVVKVLPFPAAAPPRETDVRILHFDRDLVVVDKPAGLTTMEHGDEKAAVRGRRNRQPTLLDLLPRVLSRKLATAGAPFSAPDRPARRKRRLAGKAKPSRARLPRVFPVHRLDRDTSGLMVFARTPEAKDVLARMFREHAFERVYVAVALGEVAATTIESLIADDRGDGRRGSVDDPARGRRSVTHVRPVEPLPGHTVVECRLETGRTHQIRIHLSERGHPLCGDRFYRSPLGGRHLPDDSGAPRLALHAAELTFAHPADARRVTFRSPLPPDLSAFVDRLRGSTASA